MTWDELDERFRSKVQVAGDDECWIFTGRRHPWGYGEYGVKNGKGDHDKVRAHRFVFEQLVGPIPKEHRLHVAHRCDNPPCCNPRHLFLTTNEGNVRDAVRKGRQAKGEGNGTAKLTEAKVTQIRSIYAEGQLSQQYLANLFGVSQMVICRVVRRDTWRHVP